MEEKDISPQESLTLINDMIGRARKRYTDNSIFFLMWGWIVMFASLTHYVLIEYTSFNMPYIGWSLTIPGFIASMLIGAKKGKKAVVKSYTDGVYAWLWFTLGISIFVMVFHGEKLGWYIVPLTMLMASVGTVVSGAMMKFRPLQIGGALFFGFSIFAFQVDESQQMLLMAISVLTGYLIPGYVMKKKALKNEL